jgi:uncharacterized protein
MVKKITRNASNNIANPAEMTVKEAGRRGGNATRENRGRGFFKDIGKKGGQRTAELYRELLSEFGKKGGRPHRPALNEPTREEDQH